MIPKKIHYCWLSGDRMPAKIRACMRSWKKIMPDYELVLWDKNRFDIHSVRFVAEACGAKKWASAADYIRLYAVYNEGGIYLDSDVMMHKRFDDFLGYDFFTNVEYDAPKVERYNSLSCLNDDYTLKDTVKMVEGIALQAAVFGAVQGSPFLRRCMDWYEQNPFLTRNSIGGLYNIDCIAPDIYARIAQEFGFRYHDTMQKLPGNMIVFPSEYFAGDPSKRVDITYATHCVTHSWKDYTIIEKIKRTEMYKKISRNRLLRWLCGKRPITAR